MNSEFIKAWADILDALAWPVALLLISPFVGLLIYHMVKNGVGVHLKAKDYELELKPASGLRPPSAALKPAGNSTPTISAEEISELTKDESIHLQDKLPADYFFLNHTSFLKKDKQEEYQRRTGIPLDHYNIHVIVDSYYKSALKQVERVEYILHRAYPTPIQVSINRKNNFLLKELANGEYVLKAKVFMQDVEQPILLQRYITLWDSGPRLP